MGSCAGRCICWVGICWIAWGPGLTWAVDEPSLVETSPAGVELPWEDFSDSAVEPPLLTGWVDAGYTAASVGSGRLIVQPRPNHLGDEFLLNQLVLNLQRDPDPQSDSLGFHTQLLAGSDAWLLAGPGDPDNENMRFGFVIRQLHLDVHLDLLTEGGIDLRIGRAPSYLGYDSYQAPYRPFYSLTYQWWYAQDGCDTGTWATWHATETWDLTAGIYLGSNTFFELRDKAPCGVVQARRNEDDSGSHYEAWTTVFGNQAIGQGNSQLLEGKNQIAVEYRRLFPLNGRLSQVVQANVGRADRVLGDLHGFWAGLLGANTWRVRENYDWQVRYEWFYDNGTRTDFRTSFWACTFGAAWRPRPRLTIRPEVRGDFAGVPVFGVLNVSDLRRLRREQFTAAVDAVFTF